MSNSYRIPASHLLAILPRGCEHAVSGREETMLSWSEVKEHILPLLESSDWQPPIKKRLSTELIGENEAVKEVLVKYVLY